MRLVYEELRDWNRFTGKEELISAQLRLVCKDEQEFIQAYHKVKHIEGVIWCGCPAEVDGKYTDILVNVQKTRWMTNKDVKEEISSIRAQLNPILNLGSRLRGRRR